MTAAGRLFSASFLLLFYPLSFATTAQLYLSQLNYQTEPKKDCPYGGGAGGGVVGSRLNFPFKDDFKELEISVINCGLK